MSEEKKATKSEKEIQKIREEKLAQQQAETGKNNS